MYDLSLFVLHLAFVVPGFSAGENGTVGDLLKFGLDPSVKCSDWRGDKSVSFMRNATDVLYYLKKELSFCTEYVAIPFHRYTLYHC